MTKERPILFSGAMVRATLDGRKTQTRRVVDDRTLGHLSAAADFGEIYGAARPWPRPSARSRIHLFILPPRQVRRPPVGARETWGFNPDFPGMHCRACYRADPGHEYDGIRWRPSIHMPRSACRLVLEITDVRVERLNDCSEEDARAEGCAPAWLDADDNTSVHAAAPPTYRQGFARLWRDINGPGAWEQNPWVWVVEFRRK
jgi:hypothetical protein